VKLHDSMQLKL